MNSLNILENFIFEAFPTDHFKDRFKLRCSEVNYEYGVYNQEGLTEDDVIFARIKILEELKKWKEALEKYDIEWNKGFRDVCYIFRFGDIILQKSGRLYHPTLRISDGKANQGYKIGSNFVAIVWANEIKTVLLVPRNPKCKYNPNDGPDCEPMNMEYLYDIIKKDKDYQLRKEKREGARYDINMAPQWDTANAKKWEYGKAKIIQIPTDEEILLKSIEDKKKKEFADFKAKYTGNPTIKKIKEGSYIAYHKKDLGYREKYIKQYKNLIPSSKDFLLELILSSTPDGVANAKINLKKGDRIAIKIPQRGKERERDELAEKIGYTHYLVSIDRYTPTKGSVSEADLYCNIIAPIKIDSNNVPTINNNSESDTTSEGGSTKSFMKHIQIYEAYSDSQEIKLTSRQGRDILFSIKGGRIESIQNDAGIRFPYSVGQNYNQGMKTWACNNGFKWNGEDPCPEEKVFGIRKKDIPQGHELRMMFPHKFRN